MSDDEDYYDDDDYIYLDDAPYAEAVSRSYAANFFFLADILQDDLAEHTMHSPVHPDYDPAFDTAEVWSDWEYYSDDYYDEDSPRKRRKVDGADNEVARKSGVGSDLRRKRRKLASTSEIPELSLGDSLHSCLDERESLAPVIVWRSKTETNDIPVVSEGQEEKVALLKDWRERFKILLQTSPNFSKPNGIVRRGSQKAVAVVIERKALRKGTKGKEPATSLTQNPGIPSRSKVTQPYTNGTSTTASSAAKQRQKATEKLKPDTATKPAQKPSSTRAASTHSEHKAPTTGVKRKASSLTNGDADLATTNDHSKELNGSIANENTLKNGAPQEELSGSTASERPKKRGRPPKTDTSTALVSSWGSTRNIKAASTKDSVLEPLLNGNAAGKGSSIAKAETSIEGQSGASKGSLRKRKAQDLQDGNEEPAPKRNTPKPRGRPPGSVRSKR